MRDYSSLSLGSIRTSPFLDDSDLRDRRGPAFEPLPSGIIAALRVVVTGSPVSGRVYTANGYLGSVTVRESSARVEVEGFTAEIGEFPVPGRPYRLSGPGGSGHVVFGTDVRVGSWAPVRAALLPRNYVYMPETGLRVSVRGAITAKVVSGARVRVMGAAAGSEIYAGLSEGEEGYIRARALLLSADTARPEDMSPCAVERSADCPGTIVSVNGVPVPEDGNVEMDSIDPSSFLGNSIPADAVPGPVEFSAVTNPAPAVLFDLPVTLNLMCEAKREAAPGRGRIVCAIRAYWVTGEIIVQAVLVNATSESIFPMVMLYPAISMTSRSDPSGYLRWGHTSCSFKSIMNDGSSPSVDGDGWEIDPDYTESWFGPVPQTNGGAVESDVHYLPNTRPAGSGPVDSWLEGGDLRLLPPGGSVVMCCKFLGAPAPSLLVDPVTGVSSPSAVFGCVGYVSRSGSARPVRIYGSASVKYPTGFSLSAAFDKDASPSSILADLAPEYV